MNGKQMPLWARIAIVLVTLVTCFSIVGILKSGTSNTSSPSQAEITQEQTPAPTPEPTPAPEPEKPAKQIFENDTIRAEYRGMQNIGNAMFTFYVTNKTDQKVTVGTENLAVNGQYDVTALGGAEIQPGHTASLGFFFGVETQTPLSGPDDVKVLTGDIVMFGNGIERVGSIEFAVYV